MLKYMKMKRQHTKFMEEWKTMLRGKFRALINIYITREERYQQLKVYTLKKYKKNKPSQIYQRREIIKIRSECD